MVFTQRRLLYCIDYSCASTSSRSLSADNCTINHAFSYKLEYMATCLQEQTLSCSGTRVIKLLDQDSAEVCSRQDNLIPLGSYFRCFLKRTLRGLESPEVCSLPPVASSCCKPDGFFRFFLHRRALVQHGGQKTFVQLRFSFWDVLRCSASVNLSDWTHGQPRLQPGRDPGWGHAPLVQQVHARVSIRTHHSVRAQGHP